MRIVFVTQRIDPDDPVLGATVAKIRALAERCDEVAVLAGGAVPGVLPENCRVHSFRSPLRVGRGLRFVAALSGELVRRPRPTAVVAHMCPIYALLAAPLARPLGVRVVLWFTQRRGTWKLRVATRVSNVVATAHEASLPADASRVAAIGHGIDVDAFPCVPERAASGAFELLALGRTSTAKGLPDVVRAVAAVREQGRDVRLRVVGRSETPAEVEGRAEVESLAAALALGDAVRIDGPVARSAVPALLGSVDALVNNTLGGALDKVALEAAASCVPVLASGPAVTPLLDGVEPRLAFRPGDPDDLAAAIAGLAAASPAERSRAGQVLRRNVASAHSVSTWADRMVSLCRG